MLTMRELIDLAMPISANDQIDLDADIRDVCPAKLLRIAQRVDVLRDRIEDELDWLLDARESSPLDEDSSIGVPAATARRRAERDAKRRDQLNQMTKKQAALRMSMGT